MSPAPATASQSGRPAARAATAPRRPAGAHTLGSGIDGSSTLRKPSGAGVSGNALRKPASTAGGGGGMKLGVSKLGAKLKEDDFSEW